MGILYMQLGPGDRTHYKKTTLTYLRGYAMDESPVHADLEPPGQTPQQDTNQSHSQAVDTADCSDEHQLLRNPKWLENDKKVGPSLL